MGELPRDVVYFLGHVQHVGALRFWRELFPVGGNVVQSFLVHLLRGPAHGDVVHRVHLNHVDGVVTGGNVQVLGGVVDLLVVGGLCSRETPGMS